MDDLAKKALGQIGNLGKGLGKAAKDEAKEVVKAAANQVGIERVGEEKGKQVEQAAALPANPDQLPRDKETQDFVKELYGVSSEKTSSATPKAQSEEEQKRQEEFSKFAAEHKQNSPEEIQKLFQLRQQLHKETYYDPLVAKSEVHDQSKIEEEQKKQETTEQRMERMQQEDLNKKQEEDEKKQPIAVTRAQTNIENKSGASG